MERFAMNTARLVLRPFEVVDVDDALAYASDEAFGRYVPTLPYPYSRRDAEGFVASAMDADWTDASDTDGALGLAEVTQPPGIATPAAAVVGVCSIPGAWNGTIRYARSARSHNMVFDAAHRLVGVIDFGTSGGLVATGENWPYESREFEWERGNDLEGARRDLGRLLEALEAGRGSQVLVDPDTGRPLADT